MSRKSRSRSTSRCRDPRNDEPSSGPTKVIRVTFSIVPATLRWRLARPSIRIPVLAVCVAALTIGAFAALTASTEIDATAASVLVAVVFGVATVLQERQTQRRQHTIALIAVFQSADALSAADAWTAERITSGRPVGPDLPADELTHVVALLDYYEFLAVLAQRGLIDVPLLLELRGGAMARSFSICHSYIEDRRSRVWQGLYGCLELFSGLYARRMGVAPTVPTGTTAPKH